MLPLAQWGRKWILTWQKVSTTQCLISQNHRLQEVDKLIPTLPLWAEKAGDRAREEIREKISPPLDPAAVSAGRQGLLVVGVCLVVKIFWWWTPTPRGWPPRPFIHFKCLCYIFPKVLENESVVMGGGVLVVSHSSPEDKCSASLPTWHRWVSQDDTLPPQGLTWSSTLPYQDEQVPKAQCLI